MSDKTAVDHMRILRDEVEQRLLAQSEDYRALVALDNAIAQVTGTRPVPVIGRASRPSLIGGSRSTPSQAQAAMMVIEERGEPLKTADLMPLIKEKGAIVSGKEPLINLSSALSRDKRLQSVRYDGERHWWIRGRPLPGGSLLGDESETEADSTTDHASVSDPSDERG